MIGLAVQKARREEGLTQGQLATRANVSRQAVISIEADRGSLAVLIAIARAIDFKLTGIARGTTISDQLMNRRAALKWSQNDLAQRSGVSVPTVRNLEDGHGQISSLNKVLAQIAPLARLRARPRAHWSARTGGRYPFYSSFAPRGYYRGVWTDLPRSLCPPRLFRRKRPVDHRTGMWTCIVLGRIEISFLQSPFLWVGRVDRALPPSLEGRRSRNGFWPFSCAQR